MSSWLESLIPRCRLRAPPAADASPQPGDAAPLDGSAGKVPAGGRRAALGFDVAANHHGFYNGKVNTGLQWLVNNFMVGSGL